METGFIVDGVPHGNQQAHWAEGEPQKSFWTGIKVPREALPITTYRCIKCGYLESYAQVG